MEIVSGFNYVECKWIGGKLFYNGLFQLRLVNNQRYPYMSPRLLPADHIIPMFFNTKPQYKKYISFLYIKIFIYYIMEFLNS